MAFKKFPIYRQLDKADCGPTCLRMIFKYHGRSVSHENIKRSAQVQKRGASLLGLSEAAEKYGCHTIPAKLTFDQLLTDAPLPCILHWNHRHFVVLTPDSTKKKMVVADPAQGLLTFTKEEFCQNWSSQVSEDESKGIALMITPRPAFYEQEDEVIKEVGWWSLSKYLIRYKKQFIQLLIGLFTGSCLQLIFPYLTQSIVDTGINTQNLSFIQLILLAQFTLFFARTIADFIRSQILLFVSSHINLSILSDFWIKLMRLPLSFFESKQTGDILQRINDHNRIESFITGTALQTLFSIFNLVLFSLVLLSYNVTVFLVFMGSSVLYILWIRIFLRYRRSLDYKRFAVASKERSAAIQLTQGMQEIKLNNAEHLKRWEWESLQASLFKLKFKSLKISQYQRTGAFFINEGKNIFITYLVAESVIHGHLTVGAMLAVQYIIGQLNGPIEQLISFSQQAQDASISLERLNEIHQVEEEEPADKQFSYHIPDDHTIRFQQVNFTYPGAGELPVLSNINLEFPSGKITAIVGTSGSGKTTILKLIQKFYTDYAGEVKIGESNLKHISPSHWRTMSGSVMQDGYIFNDTIEKNIAVGDQNPDLDKLIHACKVANIQSYVESLPLGLNTKIGADGKGLSTGQRQRLLIARAVYKNPSFLFFDEATNALDANNEKAIMENLLEFFQGKTVIVVAHRLSTVKNADKIMVLENGKLIEEGTHRELTQTRGQYFELVKNQLELGN